MSDFPGSVPANYERYMVPLLFRPYAQELAERAAALRPRRILETAAGTGVVTEALVARCPMPRSSPPTSTRRCSTSPRRGSPHPTSPSGRPTRSSLPFDDASFDLVVCQFGVMFFPDKVKGNAEARRVLRDGGHYLLAIWDRIERNPMSDLAQRDAWSSNFPDNPPMFMERGPFSYHEPGWIERDLKAAGFDRVEIETVELTQPQRLGERCRACGLCYGSPMRHRAREYGAGRARQRLRRPVESARSKFEGPDGFDAPMSAHIVTATK